MHPTDQAAINDFLAMMPGLRSWNPSWVGAPNCDSWDSVDCDNSAPQRVIFFEAFCDNELGVIPPSVGNMIALTHLGIFGGMTGTVPDTIGNLTQLEFLDIEANLDMDPQPFPLWIGNLTHLNYLTLQLLGFTGNIPENIGDLVNLTHLDFLYNFGVNGTIPKSFRKLINLEELYLRANDLTGIIPRWIGELKNLTILSFHSNQLTGSIPAGIGNLSKLTILELNNNFLTGLIPASLSNLSQLETLKLQNNYLEGNASAIFGKLDLINDCDVDSNLLNCPPSFIGCCTNYNNASGAPPPKTTDPWFSTSMDIIGSTTLTSSATTTSSSSTSASSTSKPNTATTTTTSTSPCSVAFQCPCSSNLAPLGVSSCSSGVWRLNGSVTNNASVTVGVEDIVVITGSFIQQTDAVLELYANGTSSGSVQATGAVILTGKLVVYVLQPTQNQTLLIISGSSISGAFDSIEVVNKASKCKHIARALYSTSSLSVLLTSQCRSSRKTIIIAVCSAVGGAILIAVVAIIVGVLLKKHNRFCELFRARTKTKSVEDLYQDKGFSSVRL